MSNDAELEAIEEDDDNGSHEAQEWKFMFHGVTNISLLSVAKIVKCQGQNNVMAYTVPYLQEEFKLSNGTLGTLFSVATVTSSFVQPILGYSVDKFGSRVCVPAAQLGLATTLLCFSVAQMLPDFALYLEVVVLFFFLRGLSLGAMETFPSACVQKWYVRKRGRVLTVVSMVQQIGLAIVAPLVSGLVLSFGWRSTFRFGAVANLMLAPAMLLMLRSTPEDCGLLPDGDSVSTPVLGKKASTAAAAAEITDTGKEVIGDELPKGLLPLYLFTFFYAMMFGGCDFEMMGMVEEAGGRDGGVDVALHIFTPLAISSACFMPFVGVILDRPGNDSSCAILLLALCGVLTCLVTNLLVYARTPWSAVLYAILRGLTSSVYSPLLNSGIAFAIFGVKRSIIGRALGINRSFALAGTGAGPLLYGITKDLFGNFRYSLHASSVPPFLLGLYFWHRLLIASCCGGISTAKGYTTVGSELKKTSLHSTRSTYGKLDDELAIEGSGGASDGQQILQAPESHSEVQRMAAGSAQSANVGGQLEEEMTAASSSCVVSGAKIDLEACEDHIGPRSGAST